MFTFIIIALVLFEMGETLIFGFFCESHQEPHLLNELADAYVKDKGSILHGKSGDFSDIPFGILSGFYYSPDRGTPVRILRFTKLHREIERKFKQLQEV